jgi:glutamine amidotransferase
MCRFIAYIGNSLVLDEVLFKPINSLIKQSIHAREMKEPLNGDGFGLGWYAPEIDSDPALYRSIQPAWNDQNLKYLARKIQSNCFFAHVRSASCGGVSQDNCHPFHYKQFLFMHNGDIGGFDKIKRYLRRKLSDKFYDFIQGQTDSEHFFALFLDNFQKKQISFEANTVASVLADTIQEMEDFKKKYGAIEDSFINAAITDGKNMVVVRYLSNPKDTPLSLYYAIGVQYECIKGGCHIHSGNNQNKSILVVSERLTDSKCKWHEIPLNHMLLVQNGLVTKLRPLRIDG